jgi:putative ABC transport system substrate-binding protein
MRRRDFIALAGGVVAGWPLAARAQQQAMPVIGFSGQSTPSVESQRLAAFLKRLRELGWMEGRTVTIEYRWAEGRDERFAEIAADFVRLKVDGVVAAKRATSVIPIVFTVAGDPIANNLVESLARPGSNVTGLSTVATDLAGKRVELLREAVPGFRRVAAIGNVNNPLSVLEMSEVEVAARRLGLEAAMVGIRRAEDIAPAFEALKAQPDQVVTYFFWAEDLGVDGKPRRTSGLHSPVGSCWL